MLVDDDVAILTLLAGWLGQAGYRVVTAANADEAMELFRQHGPDLVITDLILPGMNGIELMRRLQQTDPDVSVIVITSYGSIPSAVEAVRSGAYDYLSKPIHPDEISIVIERCLQQRALQREVSRLRSAVASRFSFDRIVGRSRAMRKVVELARRVSDRDVTVLIQSESGNGKELLARAIHRSSTRRSRPFVTVDCGALADNLLESELFGHVRGAFSGAVRSRHGLFVQADGGTLFLDAIGDMSPNLQAKLLRALQEREVKPIGANVARSVDVRIIAASSIDLDAARTAGSFRDDLFYRLAVVTLDVPPLRRRPADVAELAEHFLQRAAGDGPAKRLAPAALEHLRTHDWPGNVRELESIILRCTMMTDDAEIREEHLPPELLHRSAPSLAETTAASRRQVEREAIRDALRRTRGNRAQAARLLRISRSSLYNRLRELKIDD